MKKYETYIVKYDKSNHINVIELINQSIARDHFCILKGFHTQNTQKSILDFMKKRFLESDDIRVSGGFYYNMPDYCRLDIGDSYGNTRFSRYILFCEWNKHNHEFFKLINNLLSFRNEVANIKKVNYLYNIKNNLLNKDTMFCDVIRMIQYPIGGGFLSYHDDSDITFYPDNMLNMLLPITTRNKECIESNNELQGFDNGGFYYIHNGDKIDVEEYIDSGDIIFHDTTIGHGVNCIDNDKELDIINLCGRISLNFSIGIFAKHK